MKKLTINEEIFLISIWHLRDEAFGLNIRSKIKDLTGNAMTFGTLYNTLDYLLRKGYVQAKKGRPSQSRGGHNKVYYSITSDGIRALQGARALQEKLWKGVPLQALDTKETT